MAGGGGTSGFPLGLWVADIEKVCQGEYWTNRYILNSADMAAASAAANSIVGYERTIHGTATLFTRYRVSDGQPNTDIYQVNNVNQYGTYAFAATLSAALFVVARCDFNTIGGGRPSRKYMRGVLEEADITFNDISATRVAQINTNYVQPLVALAAYVDVDGQEITSGSVYPFVAMRQLRRGSKRKTTLTGTPV